MVDAFLVSQRALVEAVLAQVGEDLADVFFDRLDALLCAAVTAQRTPEFAKGLHQTVLLGTDAPELTPEFLPALAGPLLLCLRQGLLRSLVQLGLLFGETEHLLHGFAKAGGRLRLS